MDATTPENLNRFLANYAATGAFFIGPSYLPPDFGRAGAPEPVDRELCILIHQVHVLDAWQVGLNDLEASAIDVDDDPIIPDGVNDPPVLKVIKKKKDIQ
jgi:hypothetical protein